VKQVGGEAGPAEGAISAALFSLPPPLALLLSPSRISLALSWPSLSCCAFVLPALVPDLSGCLHLLCATFQPSDPWKGRSAGVSLPPSPYCLVPSPLSAACRPVLSACRPVPEPRSPICPVRSFTSVDGGFPGERPLGGARRVLAVPSFSLKIACFLALIRRCSELTPWSEVVRPRFFARLHFHVLSCFLMVF